MAYKPNKDNAIMFLLLAITFLGFYFGFYLMLNIL